MEYSFEKSVCEKYKIRLETGDIMNITIDETGLFQAYGSYGSYHYIWSAHGEKTFKHFLLKIIDKQSDYFLEKIAPYDYFYANDTEEAWKERILSDRRGKGCDPVDLTAEEARKMWEVLESIEYYSAEGALRQLLDHKIVYDLYCEPWYVFEAVSGYSPNAKYFAKKVLPIFAEILKKEIGQCFGEE